MRHNESRLQQACVKWFRYQYPHLSTLLFHPKNEGHGDRVSGAIAKAEGVVAGVPDLILAVPNARHNILCLELKTERGRQSPTQKAWQQAAEAAGAKYAVVRTIFKFIDTVNEYVSNIDKETIKRIRHEKDTCTVPQAAPAGLQPRGKAPRPKGIQSGHTVHPRRDGRVHQGEDSKP